MLRKYLFVFVIAGVNASCCQFSMHFKRVAVFFISKQISHKDEVFNLSIFWFGISDVDQIIISHTSYLSCKPKTYGDFGTRSLQNAKQPSCHLFYWDIQLPCILLICVCKHLSKPKQNCAENILIQRFWNHLSTKI